MAERRKSQLNEPAPKPSLTLHRSLVSICPSNNPNRSKFYEFSTPPNEPFLKFFSTVWSEGTWICCTHSMGLVCKTHDRKQVIQKQNLNNSLQIACSSQCPSSYAVASGDLPGELAERPAGLPVSIHRKIETQPIRNRPNSLFSLLFHSLPCSNILSTSTF